VSDAAIRPEDLITRRRRMPSPGTLVLIPLALVMIFPFFWLVVTSLQTLAQSRTFGRTSPCQFHNYVDAWTQAPFGRWLANTTIVSVTVVISNLVFCSLAGYALARMRFFGSGALFLVILATLMVPFQVVMVPRLLIVRGLGLVDMLPALMAPNWSPRSVCPACGSSSRRCRSRSRRRRASTCQPSRNAWSKWCSGDASGPRHGRHHDAVVDVERLSLAPDRHSVRKELHAQLGLMTFQGAHTINWPLSWPARSRRRSPCW